MQACAKKSAIGRITAETIVAERENVFAVYMRAKQLINPIKHLNPSMSLTSELKSEPLDYRAKVQV